MRWNYKRLQILKEDSLESNNMLKGLVAIPVPTLAIEELKNQLDEKAFRSYGLRFLYHFSLKLVSQTKYIPFCDFLHLNSDVIRKFIGGGRKIGTSIRDMVFISTTHSQGRYSKSYRYKDSLLCGGVSLLYYEPKNTTKITEAAATTAVEDRNEAEDKNLKVTSKIISSLDFSEVNLSNTNLLSDISNKVNSEIDRSIGYDSDASVNTVKYYSIKGKIKKVQELVIPEEDFQEYLFLEKELKFQRKKYQIDNLSLSAQIKRDNVTNRLHHQLTRLPSATIPYIRINGERLVEIDMINCHYTLFSNILLGYMKDSYGHLPLQSKTYGQLRESLRREFSIPFHTIFKHIINTILDSNTPLYKLSQFNVPDVVSEYADLILFIVAAIKGKLYEVVGMKLYGTDKNRDDVKKVLMGVFYGDYNLWHSKDKKLFKKEFPTVWEMISDLKAYMCRSFKSGEIMNHDLYEGCIISQESKNKSDFKAGNSCFPILLQNVESQLFIDKILYPLQQEGYTIISKHDSILTPISEVPKVLARMNQILDTELGVSMYSLKTTPELSQLQYAIA